MKVDPKIDELLNGFIDGELTQRQQTEVRRLLVNDTRLVQRLQELHKCRTLISSMPSEEAPYGLADDVMASLERRTLLREPRRAAEGHSGVRELLARRVFAAAAMIGLAAVLAVVIYGIVGPAGRQEPLVATDEGTGRGIAAVEPRPSAAKWEFRGRLELKAAAFMETDSAVNRAIEGSGLSDCTDIERQPGSSRYTISCGRRDLNVLLENLRYVWGRFDSRILSVQTEQFGGLVVINAVTSEQVRAVVDQDSPEKGAKVAGDFAVLNNITQQLPGRQIMMAIGDGRADLPTIVPKPRLTKDEELPNRPPEPAQAKPDVHLVLEVAGGK